jgi:peptidyl-tRNA hydrolase, PTH1 family
MKLIVGLGNPGDKYKATRHNAGFWLVERLAAQSGVVLRKDSKFQALVGRHEASGAWLVLPQSFMNSSGRPVQMMASFFKITPADMLIVHDELDLPAGAARLKQGGGVAGHNGLKDISSRLGSHEYWRLRLGIGRPADRAAMIEYVLHKPAQDERAAIDAAIERALEVLPLVMAGDLQGAMLKLHTQGPEDKAARPKPAERTAAPAQREGAQSDSPRPPRERTIVEGSVDAGAPAPVTVPVAPARTTSSIEKFGAAAQAGGFDADDRTKTGKATDAAQPARSEPAEPAKSSGLNSLLRKFLPGSDPARKK